MGIRTDFEANVGFPLDDFQRHALDALDAGRSVLVAAPTGSGKTLVAEYAIARALARGGKAFYTTPLKALSNQKFADLVRIHGREDVGLLTGDNALNGDAPVVVMTTEVLRNMIYAASPALVGLDSVVLDEVHYLQDRYRGAVWEEVIVHLPPEVDLVCLSATVSNAEEFAAWIETVRGATTPVIEERRPVELHHRYLVGERDVDALHLLPTFVGQGDDLRPNPEAERLDRRVGRGPRGAPRASRRLRAPGRVEVVELLASEELLPAIVFIFSRKGCDQAVDACMAAGVRLTTADERVEIRRIAQAHVRGLADADLTVLGYSRWLAGLEAGVAAHHAGMVPPMKEAVEAAFAAGLVKVVFATETLALGINMPARSVVIEKLTKFTGERHEFLTPGDYTQLTGRAGRRGIDTVGYAVVLWSPWVPFEQVAGLAARRTDALRSSFRPTYNMAVNLVGRYSAERAHHLLNLSFAQFRADRDVVALERQLAKVSESLEREREQSHSEYGDIVEYRKLLDALGAERRGSGAGRRIIRAMEALVPGDVLWIGGHGGKAIVLAHEARRGSTRLLVLAPSRHLVRLGPDAFTVPPVSVGRVEIPQPYAPRSRTFQRALLESLRRVKVRRPDRVDDSTRIAEIEAEIAAHPVDGDPARNERVRAAATVTRLERDRARLEQRVRARTDSLARQLDRVRRVLEAWGYLDGWSLTPAGAMLARLYTETDLLLAESLRDGLFDGLSLPEVAALASCFTYERRGSDGAPPVPPARWPSSKVAQRSRRIDLLRRTLAADEDDAGLPETRASDPGFTAYAYEWAAGDDLGAVLDDDELTGGDFVRHVKQCIDLLRQIAEVAPEAGTRGTAHAAADACHRGVVVASSPVDT